MSSTVILITENLSFASMQMLEALAKELKNPDLLLANTLNQDFISRLFPNSRVKTLKVDITAIESLDLANYGLIFTLGLSALPLFTATSSKQVAFLDDFTDDWTDYIARPDVIIYTLDLVLPQVARQGRIPTVGIFRNILPQIPLEEISEPEHLLFVDGAYLENMRFVIETYLASNIKLTIVLKNALNMDLKSLTKYKNLEVKHLSKLNIYEELAACGLAIFDPMSSFAPFIYLLMAMDRQVILTNPLSFGAKIIGDFSLIDSIKLNNMVKNANFKGYYKFAAQEFLTKNSCQKALGNLLKLI